MDLTRYSRQIVYANIGKQGQQKLIASRVAIAGIGALGTVIANNLSRAGVGYIRLIDRDIVDISNLPRQTLFTEDDVARRMPKAVAAYKHLCAVNSGITLEPVVMDINSATIDTALLGVDLVLDGSDNMEVRQLINEWCVKQNIPWVYGAALQAGGASMTIIPGETPCFRCLYPDVDTKSSLTCSTAGILNMITGIIACVESAEAVKILTGSDAVNKKLFLADVWQNNIEYIGVEKNAECPVCGAHSFQLLSTLSDSYTVSLCGRDAVQVVPASGVCVQLEDMAQKLKKAGRVELTRFMLTFDDDHAAFQLFPDGRAIIQRVTDEKIAKSIYAEYIGL
jgi:adenylyltransferase/sulfurtransferase